jgi:hypothetical protein
LSGRLEEWTEIQKLSRDPGQGLEGLTNMVEYFVQPGSAGWAQVSANWHYSELVHYQASTTELERDKGIEDICKRWM